MEGGLGEEEITTTTTTTSIIGSPPPPPPPHLDEVEEDEEILTVGSPTDDLGIHEEKVEEEAAEASTVPDNSSSSSSETVVLTDELRDKIIRQVEYYFSDENLPTDKFLMKFLKKNKQGFIPVGVIASFRKMKKLIQNNELVAAALRESSQLVVSSDGKKVKRAHPLPVLDVKDAQSRTVVVENLPANQSTENLQKIFGDAGNIKSICIRDPHAIESAKSTKAETSVSGKIHALIEYETVEAAMKAVSTLNDEKNWRSGMRVEILLSRMSKYGLASKKSGKGLGHPEKNDAQVSAKTGDKKSGKGLEHPEKNDAQVSAKTGDEQNHSSHDHHNDQPGGQEEEEHLPSEKQGRKSRNRGRPKAHKQSGYGHGHGYAHSATGTQGLSVNKPPPGPKMPDGTKGFTMGRGRPLVGTVGQHQYVSNMQVYMKKGEIKSI